MTNNFESPRHAVAASDNVYSENPENVPGKSKKIARDYARCEREIAEIQRDIKPAWVIALTVEDWRMEQRLLTAGACR